MFTENTYQGSELARSYNLAILGFAPSVPRRYWDLGLDSGAYVNLFDPLGDPDIAVNESCFSCASAIGRVIAHPVPEPESWAMLMAGLGFLGYAARRKSRLVSGPVSSR